MPPPIKPPTKPAAQKGGLQRPEDALARAQKQKDAIADECSALEQEVEELKVKYEMYFLGVEKREPVKWREELKKRVLRIKEAFTRNAALRFRLQSLHARFLSYERLWLRSAKEKEEGTYHRDVFKAKMHQEVRARRDREDREARAAEEIAALSSGLLPPRGVVSEPTPPPAPRAAAGTPPPTAPPAATPPPAATSGGAVADRQMRDLYTQYIAAKKQCGEDVSRLTYEAVAKSVNKQVPDILNRYKAKSVEFKVVVKDGKASLKAVPRT
ncbi:MAG TPA: MXAN_5187 C-terminal domain-containing protein [Anaeromyxobacteraceae bacterium]|nr:MXAN_5187 C-terminal domain-containing protein [Anaeromyxobacteraceae bacterium]